MTLNTIQLEDILQTIESTKEEIELLRKYYHFFNKLDTVVLEHEKNIDRERFYFGEMGVSKIINTRSAVQSGKRLFTGLHYSWIEATYEEIRKWINSSLFGASGKMEALAGIQEIQKYIIKHNL